MQEPEEARIFVVDDDPDFIELTCDVLTQQGYEVVGKAGSFEDAIEEIEKVTKKRVNIAVIDACLIPGDRTDKGKEIANILRGKDLGIKIISYSGSPRDWGDKNIEKTPEGLEELIMIVPKLLTS